MGLGKLPGNSPNTRLLSPKPSSIVYVQSSIVYVQSSIVYVQSSIVYVQSSIVYVQSSIVYVQSCIIGYNWRNEEFFSNPPWPHLQVSK